ncbi:unnamed protein product [Rhodiola kirilowii]
MSNTIPLQISKFNKWNFKNWVYPIDDIFQVPRFMEFGRDGLHRSSRKAFDELQKEEKDLLVDTRKKDQKALFAIFQAM